MNALAFGFQSRRAADAWAEFSSKASPVDAMTNTYHARLVSKWTRNGRVPTLAEAEAMEAREYAMAETLDGMFATTEA